MNNMLGSGGLEAVRDAFKTLQGSHPEVLAKLSAALSASRSQPSGAPQVTVALRDAAALLSVTDEDAARILFTLAELLAEVSRSRE
jgi:hypothetical protein